MASPLKFTDLIIPNGGIDETKHAQEIPDNKWASAENVEPMIEGCRSRKGSSIQNAVVLQSIAESHEGGTNDREFADTASEYISQSFQLTAATVSRVSVRLKIGTGDPSTSGNIAAAIYTDDAGGPPGKPNVVVTGAEFATFSEVADSDITSEYKWHHFTLATGVALAGSTTYHLVIRHSGALATGTHNFEIEEVTTPSGYANGNVSTSTDAATWVTVGAADLNFRIYAGAPSVTGIIDYQLSDGTNAYHLVYADSELYKNVSGTMTSVSARERVAMTAGQNNLLDWAIGNDRVFLTNNVEISKKFYLLSGTEYWENEGIDKPTAALTLGTAAGDGLTGANGIVTFSVDYYYWNSDLNQPSDRKHNGGSTAQSVTPAAGEHITISGIPAAPVRENDRVTHIRFEVKLSTGQFFRFAKEITIGTTSTTIGGTDEPFTTAGEYRHAVPPIHECKVVAENRQFIGNVADHPYRVMFSEIIGATPYYESYHVNNKRDFGKGDGDYITALAFIPPRTLVVGFKNSLWAMDARNPGTSDRFKISSHVGIAGKLSFKVINSKLYFISDADEQKGCYVWEGQGEPKLLLGIDDTFKGLNGGRLRYASCAHLSPGDNRFQWWTLVSASGKNSHNKVIVFDYLLKSFSIYNFAFIDRSADTQQTGNVLGNVETSNASKVYRGGDDGLEYLQDVGTQDGALDFDCTFKMKAFDFGAPHIHKRLRFIDVKVGEQTSGALAIQIQRDYGSRGGLSTSIQFTNTGNSFVLGTSTLGSSAVLGSIFDVIPRIGIRGRARVFQPSFNDQGPWYMKGVAFGIQPTGKR